MEIVGLMLFIGIIILIIMLSNFKSATTQNFKTINNNIKALKKDIEALKVDGVKVEQKSVQKSELSVSGQKLTTSSMEKTVKQPVAETKPPIHEDKPKSVENILEKEINKEEVKPLVQEEKTTSHIQPLKKPDVAEIEETEKKTTPPPKKELEKVIGENWLNKIGIAVLVIGIGFFVKYAIDQNWIGEIGRVLIGLGTGALLLAIAHFLRKKYTAFSSVLIGGGISTFYYTIAIAYQFYHLFSQTTGFIAVTAITILGTGLSLFYNRKELAIISLLGAFTAPFMVPGETPNYNVFFTYIAVVNTGMLILSFFKNWRILTYLSFGFTLIYFGGWSTVEFWIENPVNIAFRKTGLIFANIYFIQFLGMVIVHNVMKKIEFKSFELVQLLGVSGFYMGVMLLLLDTYNNDNYQGIFAFSMSVFFIVLTLALGKNVDRKLTQTLMGKAILMATLGIFLLIDADYTTAFWSFESILLLWLAKKNNDKLFRIAGFGVQTLAFISLLFLWSRTYFLGDNHEILNLNTSFVSGLILTASIFVTRYFISHLMVKKEGNNLENVLVLQTLFGIALLYLTGLFEVIYQGNKLLYNDAVTSYLFIYHFIFVIGILIWSNFNKTPLLKEIGVFIGFILLFAYLTYGQYFLNNLSVAAFNSETLDGYYHFHYLYFVLAFAILGLMNWLKHKFIETPKGRAIFGTILSVFGMAIMSVELNHLAIDLWANSPMEINAVLRPIHVGGYTVIWALYAFIIMIIGLRRNNRVYRVFALIALLITLIKLFTYDILNISTGGKILAFISLGVVLLIVSFLYQKLKRLIVDGNSE